MDLATPSQDNVTYLNQWLHARKGEAPAGSFFADNIEDADAEIVQLVAEIVGSGTAYYRAGCISRSVLILARKLNKGNRFALTEVFLNALITGKPTFAMAQGVASESVIA